MHSLLTDSLLHCGFNRPGCCSGDGSAAAYKSSTTFPDETLTFIKSYPLMDESVPSVNDRPYFTRTTSRYCAERWIDRLRFSTLIFGNGWI